jgi:hypothetical protein
MSERKKLKETKVGGWLRKNAPKVLDVAGDVLPDAGALSLVRNLVFNDNEMSAEAKIEFQELAKEAEVAFQAEVSKRWKADMGSDSLLSKNIRPAMLILLTLFYITLTIWDGVSQRFMPPQNYIDLLEVLMLTAFGAYFAGRSLEKTMRK